MNPVFGRVFFMLRHELDLSASECLLADVILSLSKKTGWCFASRAYLAGLLGISTRSLRRMLRTLFEKGIVEPHPRDVRQLRTSQHFRRIAEACGADRSSSQG